MEVDHGITPEIPFPLTENHRRLGSVKPMVGGILPMILLSVIEIKVRTEERLKKERGIVPDRPLDPSAKNVKLFNPPNSSGTFPPRLLCVVENSTSGEMFPKEGGGCLR